MIDLSGKNALVTGSGRGIGLGCARQLAKAGANVVLNDRELDDDLTAAANELKGLGGQVWTAPGDIFERSGCESVVRAAIEHAGHLDILVSNPAYSRRQTFLQYDPALFELTLKGTLTSGFNMAQLVARHLVERGAGGKIVFISSVQGELPISNSVAYNAAKAGVNHMGKTIAVELTEHRINVNVIAPGWIDTPGERVTFGEETIAKEAENLPWKRLGTPDDVGAAATFLCSDAADYITGTVTRVDGLFRYKDYRPAVNISRQLVEDNHE